jgi:hypothetical protein
MACAVDFIEPRLKISAAVLPSLIDSGSHVIRKDDELRRPAVVKGAETYDINLGHSARKIAEKRGESKRGRFRSPLAARYALVFLQSCAQSLTEKWLAPSLTHCLRRVLKIGMCLAHEIFIGCTQAVKIEALYDTRTDRRTG